MKALYKEIGRAAPSSAVSDMRAFTVCVGRRATPADYYAAGTVMKLYR